MNLPRGLYEIAYDILDTLQREGPLILTAIYRKTPTDKHTRKVLDILLRKGLIFEEVRPKSFLKASTKLNVESSLERGERPPKMYERVFNITNTGVEALRKLEDLKSMFD